MRSIVSACGAEYAERRRYGDEINSFQAWLEICLYIQYYEEMSSAQSSEISALLESSQMWRAREFLGAQSVAEHGVPTGCVALDAALPSQGWPVGQICELLCAQGGCIAWPLIWPALLARLKPSQALLSKTPSQLVLINPPFQPYMPAWLASGMQPGCLIKIDTSAHAQLQSRASWAAEQALHCAATAAVVAWLPRAQPDALRRLQIAAAQAQALLFVVRPIAARDQSSPAALRLVLHRLDALHGEIHIFKCRGSAAPSNIQIELLSPQWRALLQARQRRMQIAPHTIHPHKTTQQITTQPTAKQQTTTSQQPAVFRMTPRSQGIELLPDNLLFGNERAAEGPARSVKAHHGLDRTLTYTSIPFNTVSSIPPERALKREARHARSR